MPDHVHILIGLNPALAISDLVKEIKTSSNHFIKNERLIKYKFSWQEGYGAFSYSISHLNNVVAYILNQPVHHRQKNFHDEYIEFLKAYEISYDNKYLFDRD